MNTELPDRYCATCGEQLIHTLNGRFRFSRTTGEKIPYGKWHCPTLHCAHDGNHHDFQKVQIWLGLMTDQRCVHCGIDEDYWIRNYCP